MSERAVFLDRDGTLVYPRHYPSRPEELVLYPGIAPELLRLQRAGFRLVVVTNQSGLARGLFGETDLACMHLHLRQELARDGVYLDGIYYCPHHVDGIVPELAVDCSCRKPRPGLLIQAAVELDLALERSWFVGDILDDVEAGRRAGCRTVLVDLGTEGPPERPMRRPTYVARDTRHALRLIAAAEGLEPVVEPAYRPASWTSVSGGPWAAPLRSPCGSDIAGDDPEPREPALVGEIDGRGR
jgi:D-glycero-D-manno-heptose 1,7-bisphosphate phosphatase